ncbi:MAG: DMT family transporter [Lachnospiraceae bacterium]|nr:DMT family transporter [Lachnospiraceae bacterium]
MPSGKQKRTKGRKALNREGQGREKGKRIRILFFLHIFLMVYSFSGIFSKLAAGKDFMSLPFCLFYALSLFVLFIYAIGWQQFIKRLPLTEAYANRAVSVIWGCIWGVFIFHERLTLKNLIGAVLVIGGVILFSLAEAEAETSETSVKGNPAKTESGAAKDMTAKDMTGGASDE